MAIGSVGELELASPTKAEIGGTNPAERSGGIPFQHNE